MNIANARGTPMPMRRFKYRHVVGFEDTNVVGNVYYANHVRWQGRCREMFLREHCPDVLDALQRDLRLVTTRVSCEYLEELVAFDEVIIRMHLAELRQNRVGLGFEYHRHKDGAETLIARGFQEIAAMRLEDGELSPTPLPQSLEDALKSFRHSE